MSDKSSSSSSSNIEIGLGDIIQIIAPTNSTINDQVYLIEYIDEIAHEKWLSEQIRVSPEDKKLLKAYIESFDNEQNKERTKARNKQIQK